MEICSRCGEEIRLGTRDGFYGWWHREGVDHRPGHGVLAEQTDWALLDAELHKPRTRVNAEGEVETYTTARLDAERMKKAAKATALAELDAAEGANEVGPIEPIEVRCQPLPLEGRAAQVVDVDGQIRDVEVPGGVRTMLNLVAKLQGWQVKRLTYARGPYMGSSGKSLGVSDSVVLIVSAPPVDAGTSFGVASWRDGGSDWAWRINPDRTVDHLGARALMTWMKEHLDG